MYELPIGRARTLLRKAPGGHNQTFGEFKGTMDPRSMQFALRYEF